MINADELTFTRAIEVATKIEDAVKVVKETVFGSIPERVHKFNSFPKLTRNLSLLYPLQKIKPNTIVAEKPVIWHPIVISRTLLAITVNFKVV